MPIFVSDLQGWVQPADVFVALHLNDENAFWLDREIHATKTAKTNVPAKAQKAVAAAK